MQIPANLLQGMAAAGLMLCFPRPKLPLRDCVRAAQANVEISGVITATPFHPVFKPPEHHEGGLNLLFFSKKLPEEEKELGQTYA